MGLYLGGLTLYYWKDFASETLGAYFREGLFFFFLFFFFFFFEGGGGRAYYQNVTVLQVLGFQLFFGFCEANHM